MAKLEDFQSSLKILENIEDAVKCTICLVNSKNAHLCSQCSQVFCLECIEKWLEKPESNEKCPHCQQIIVEKLVKIRWLDDILKVCDVKLLLKENIAKESELKARSSENWDTCKIHKQPASLFCSQCRELTCFECWDSENHIGHRFKTVKQEFSNSYKILEKKIEELKTIKNSYHASNQENIAMSATISKNKNEILEKLKIQKAELMDIEKERYESKLQKICDSYYQKAFDLTKQEKVLIAQLNLINKEIVQASSRLDKIFEDSRYCLRTQSKYDIVKRIVRFEREVSKIEMLAIKSKPIDAEEYIIYELKLVHKIDNFSKLLNNYVCHSKQFRDLNGNYWRLRFKKIDVNKIDVSIEILSTMEPVMTSLCFQIVNSINASDEKILYAYKITETLIEANYLYGFDCGTISQLLVDDSLSINALLHVH